MEFTKNSTITVVGAGLAGSECAWQLAEMGYQVVLIEMRGVQSTPAHKTNDMAELVCSNSFGSLGAESGPGQLKWEADQMQALILKAARDAAVPAGQALGVDREKFAALVTKVIEKHPRIEVRREVVSSLSDLPRPVVLATGPLTSEALSVDLQKHFGNEFLYFFDAIAPIIDTDSINMDICWKADRYDKGTPDYINCPFTKDQYNHFISEIAAAKKLNQNILKKLLFLKAVCPSK